MVGPFSQGKVCQPFGAAGRDLSKAELTPPSLRSLGTAGHIAVGERIQLELSWHAWHSASFAQPGSEYMRSTKTNSQVGRCPLVLERGHQVRVTTPPHTPQGHGGGPVGPALSGFFLRPGKLSFTRCISGTFPGLTAPPNSSRRVAPSSGSPAAPTALGLLGPGMQGREAEAPTQEVVLCPGLAARAGSFPALCLVSWRV